MAEEMSLKEFLKKNGGVNAASPIDYNLLEKVPFFEEVFSGDRGLWKLITQLAGATGIAHLEDKNLRPGQKIVHSGSLDQMVFWVIAGVAEVVAEAGGKKRVVKVFKEGECFGELTIIKAQPRTADVIAGKNGARILEFDWAVAERCFELKALFTELLMKTIAEKLQDSFGMPGKIIDQASRFLKNRDEKIKRLESEISKLKNL